MKLYRFFNQFHCKILIFCLFIVVFPVISCKKNDHIQKIDKSEFELYGSMGEQQIDSESRINPPKWIHGIWLLDSSYSRETEGWVDRRNEGVILKFNHDSIFINGKSINEDEYYENTRNISGKAGNDFLHGDYFEIAFFLGNYNKLMHRYYYPMHNSMRVEYYDDNVQKRIENYQLVFGFSESINITDVLTVRSSPSINGTIIQTKKFGDIFQIYDKQGSGDLISEGRVVDLWYKISPDREEWVNAFYVREFPFYIAGEDSTYRPDVGDNDMYTSSIIVNVKSAYENNGVWLLNMDVYDLKDGVGSSYEEQSRTESIQESYYFNGKTVKLQDNLFNHIIKLYNDIKNKIDDITPSVAWSWYQYDADEYDLSEIELEHRIKVGKPINYIWEILGPFYFQEYNNVFVYSQWGVDIYGQFKIKFFTGEDDGEVLKIIYEIPFIK
ncbi:MAG: SH3 domain-containing protein [Treponema sp.]|jgi:hypothetical protein|nr:SH3 domain-containing protein [Treponema sp.]